VVKEDRAIKTRVSMGVGLRVGRVCGLTVCWDSDSLAGGTAGACGSAALA